MLFLASFRLTAFETKRNYIHYKFCTLQDEDQTKGWIPLKKISAGFVFFFINVAVNKPLSVFGDLSRLMPHAFAGFQRTKTRRRIE